MRTDSLGEFEQLLLLAIVHLGEDAYGVTIRQEVERRTGRDIAIGAMYTTLNRLETKGFVKSVMTDPTAQRGGRAKRQFKLRPTGATALRQSRERLAKMWDGLQSNLEKARS
jgi:PadR family transcriptional regulator PadR